MKKNIFYTMLIAMVTLLVTSCGDKESEGKSRFTYYPVLELQGDDFMVIDKGSTFQDPGFTATLNGEDVSSEVNVQSNINSDKSGVYTVVYSIVNSDGIAANARRTVVVLDSSNAVEGLYYTTPTSYRLREGAQVTYGDSFQLLVIDNGDGTYSADDLLGGWYCQRAGYGDKYAMPATIKIQDGVVIIVGGGGVAGWSDGYSAFEGTFDAATSTFNLKTTYAGMDFIQTWVKG
ncbi:BT_2262 family domain-containing protein [Prevotella sp. MA2016]|uniref:BT_2262 family domain-containing protein n=1 Tax=Prevotella sp. MA2016 TaxID=1408310 RepID=UPI00048E59CB|nr:BT_2262 family domain-containing protein [Prevotella sp. MA2016]